MTDTPTLAEIEARHEAATRRREDHIVVIPPTEVEADRAALLQMVRERDTRLAEIAEIAHLHTDPLGVAYCDIYDLATKETP